MILKMALLGSNKCFINCLETSWWDSKWGCTDSGLKGKNCSYYNGGIVGTSDLKYKAFMCNRYYIQFNPLNPELNPICSLLALLAHHFLHISRIMVKSLTLRLLISYIYGAHILDVSRSHTTAHHSR